MTTAYAQPTGGTQPAHRRLRPISPTPTPRWWADAGGAAAILSLLVVTALWVSNQGVQQVRGGGSDALSALGRLTGLWAADLLLLQVLLMARIPLVERAFGQDRLARWHRWTGFTSFHLMLVHVGLIVLGYAGSDRMNVIAETWSMVITYPGMLLATAGTLLLIMVVVTSLRATRRRLRYESWHLLHLYAYLGAGLALPHQLWTGTDFLSSPIATVYWWTLYATAAGSVVVYRLGLPAWRSWRHRLIVTHVAAEAPGVTSVYLDGRRLDRLPVRAGQFFQWRFLDGPGWTRSHPYSLSASPVHGRLRVTVKDLGDGSARIATLRPGTRVLIEGPYGNMTGEHYTGGPVLMLACGIGVTPLIALLGELPYRPGDATLVYRARSAEEIAFRRDLTALAERRGVRMVYLLGSRSDRSSWLPAQIRLSDGEALRRISPRLESSHVYICGPDAWTEAVRQTVAATGVPKDRLHTEHFAW
jgi:predicted ferric reductase